MKKLHQYSLLALFLLAVVGFQVVAAGLWNEEEAVHIRGVDIENSTLVIGTHLIYLGSLTQELYTIAVDTAGESRQHNIYYKSELAAGAWFDITTAHTLADITTAGTPVENKVIEALFFTHHTKSDGITYDLRSGLPVNIFDIISPYDLEAMPELAPLKTHYDVMKEMEGESEEGKKKIERGKNFFATEVQNDKTKEFDEIVVALQVYLDVLKANNGGGAEISAVEGVMESVDASRRVEVFQIVQEALAVYGGELQWDATNDTALQGAVNDSIKNVEIALLNNQGKMLDKGTTVMSAVVYQVSQELCQDALFANHTACDKDVGMLIAYENIQNAVVGNKALELQLLRDILLIQGKEKFTGGLAAGENDPYKKAVGELSAGALLRGIADEYYSQVNTYRGEFEFFIEAHCLRVTNAEGQGYIEECLRAAQSYYNLVKLDNFQSGLENSVDKHIEYLTKKKRALELLAGGNAQDKLIVEKGDLQLKHMAALDKNDLLGAKAIEEQIATIDSQIAEITSSQLAEVNKLQEQLNDLQKELDNAMKDVQVGTIGGSGTTAEGNGADSKGAKVAKEVAVLRGRVAAKSAELSTAQAGLSEGTLGNVIVELKKSCLSAVTAQKGNGETGRGNLSDTDATAQENADSLSRNIDTLGELLNDNYKTVFPILKDIYNEMVTERNLNDNRNFDKEIAKIETLILDSNGAFEAANRRDKNAEDLSKAADRFFTANSGSGNGLLDANNGKETGRGEVQGGGEGGVTSQKVIDHENFSKEEQGAVKLLALALLTEEIDNKAAEELMAMEAQEGENTGNSLVFPSAKDAAGDFVSVSAIAKYTGMRYVWLKNRNEGTLAKGATYYTFSGYSDKVTVGTRKEYMTRPAMKQKDLYIPNDYAKAKFGFESQSLSGCGYSVLTNDTLLTAANELKNVFLN